ncbi:MAG: LamG domain-containing protein [Verrucomicrobia bacterium]|nr:LamG domain-containing protein [Verrucomicrobiota bacterium]
MFTRCPIKTTKKFFALMLTLFAAGLLSAAELKFYAPFDEGDGKIALDKIGQIEGKVGGGAIWVDGKVGKALQFDGKDKAEGVVVANASFSIKGSDNFLQNLGGEAFTITAWIKPNSSRPSNKTCEILNTGSDKGPGWRFFYSYKILTFRSGNGTDFWDAKSDPVNDKIINDDWNHIAVTRSTAGIVSVYINGKKTNETESAVEITKGLSGRLTIGAYGGGAAYGFKGIIDEVKIYQGEVTPEEILKDAQAK